MSEYVAVDDLKARGWFFTWDGHVMTDDKVRELLLQDVPTVELAKETRRRPLVFGYSYTAPLRRGPLERRLVGQWEKEVDDEG